MKTSRDCFEFKTDVVVSVKDLLQSLTVGSVLTMIITLEKSGGYCVTSVIDESLDATVVQNFLDRPQNT